VPYRKELQADYLPARLTSDDYPKLIDANAPVDTIACQAVLIAYNWPKGTDRYRRIQKFVDNFFPRLAEFQKPPRHPKWKETNLAAVLPGWTRFAGAQEWLDNRPEVQRDQFDKFLAARKLEASEQDRERLFKEFVQWRNAQGAN
jgi:uncharacterized protein